MKFSKLLKQFEGGTPAPEDDPQGDFFLRYKLLKKKLKAAADRQEALLASRKTADGNPDESKHEKSQLPLNEEEKEFIQMLQEDLVRINSYFMEQEEEAVIKLHALQERRAVVECSEETNEQAMESLRAEFVDFHGEMVLLLHWSLVNYAGIVKILKKHDKLMGGHAQKSFLQNVLQQPFTSTENISRLVREAEGQVQCLSGVNGRPSGGHIDVEDKGEEASLLKRTRAALGMLTQLQSNAHTPSTFLRVDVASPDAKRIKTNSDVAP